MQYTRLLSIDRHRSRVTDSARTTEKYLPKVKNFFADLFTHSNVLIIKI